MWVAVEPKESGEEPVCLAGRKVLRHKGWQTLVFCGNRREAEELASLIRQEGFEASVTEPLRSSPARSHS